jgi:electron transport complex protein RnfD
VISPRIPVAYIGTVAVISLITSGFDLTYTAYQIFGGGLILGAVFMATDYASSPVSKKGKIIFGIGCGVLTMLIRLYSGSAEGVSYSILFMNVASPLIEKYSAPRVFGSGGAK